MIIPKRIAVKPKDCCLVVEYTDTDTRKKRHRRIYLLDVITQHVELNVNHDELFEKIYVGILEKHHKRYLRSADKGLLRSLVITLIDVTAKELRPSSSSLQHGVNDSEDFDDLSMHSEKEKIKNIRDNQAWRTIEDHKENQNTTDDATGEPGEQGKGELDKESEEEQQSQEFQISSEHSHKEEDEHISYDEFGDAYGGEATMEDYKLNEIQEEEYFDQYDDAFRGGYENLDEFEQEDVIHGEDGDDFVGEYDNYGEEEYGDYSYEETGENTLEDNYYTNEDNDDIQEDLNHVSEQELIAAKSRMDIAFEKNRKAPNDDNYVYDVQEEFNPSEPSGWDSDDE